VELVLLPVPPDNTLQLLVLLILILFVLIALSPLVLMELTCLLPATKPLTESALNAKLSPIAPLLLVLMVPQVFALSAMLVLHSMLLVMAAILFVLQLST